MTGACLSDVTSGYSGIFAYTELGSVWSIMTTTVSADSSTVGAIAIVGWNIKHASDTSTSTLSSTTSNSPTPTPTSSSTPSPKSASAPTSGLATGTAVGIGVGVALGVIGLVCLFASFCLIRRRRQRRERDTSEARMGDLPGVAIEAKPALGGSNVNMSRLCPSEVDNDGERRVSELHSEHLRASPVELSG